MKLNQPSFHFGSLFLRGFIFLLGLIVLMAAVNKLYTYCNYRFRGVMVYGVIEHPSSGRDIGGRPLIQYKDASGSMHEFKSKAKTHWFYKPQKGEKIKIFFYENEPQRAIVDNFFYYVFLPLIFFVVGTYCCLKSIHGYPNHK